MEEFEANRKRGFGVFMTSADLRKADGVSLPNVLRSLRGADIVRSNNGSFITSKRAPTTGCPIPGYAANRQAAINNQEALDECLRRERIFYVPEGAELRQGYKRACYPVVYVDGQLMNAGRPTAPFDLTAYATEQVEAVEWYESSSQAPTKTAGSNAPCGVLILHVRKRR
jgi:hypothetical protein